MADAKIVNRQWRKDISMTDVDVDTLIYFTIPTGLEFVSVLNNTNNIIELYQEVTTLQQANPLYSIVQNSPYYNQTVPLGQNGSGTNFTLIYRAGGGDEVKLLTLLFSTVNMQINGPTYQPGGTSNTAIISDSVGLAKSVQFPAALGGTGGLKVEIENTPNVVVTGNVGISGTPTVNVSGTVTVGTHAVTISGTPTVVDSGLGVGGTGIVLPSGASGKLGWLSGIFNNIALFKTAFDTIIATVAADVLAIKTRLPAALATNGSLKTKIVGSNVSDFKAITKSDTVDIVGTCISIMVEVPGDVAFVKPDNTVVVVPSAIFSAGTVIPFTNFKRINSTATTATGIWGFFE